MASFANNTGLKFKVDEYVEIADSRGAVISGGIITQYGDNICVVFDAQSKSIIRIATSLLKKATEPPGTNDPIWDECRQAVADEGLGASETTEELIDFTNREQAKNFQTPTIDAEKLQGILSNKSYGGDLPGWADEEIDANEYNEYIEQLLQSYQSGYITDRLLQSLLRGTVEERIQRLEKEIAAINVTDVDDEITACDFCVKLTPSRQKRCSSNPPTTQTKNPKTNGNCKFTHLKKLLSLLESETCGLCMTPPYVKGATCGTTSGKVKASSACMCRTFVTVNDGSARSVLIPYKALKPGQTLKTSNLRCQWMKDNQTCPHKAISCVDFDGAFLCKSHMSVAHKRKLGILCGATLSYLPNGCMKYSISGYYKMCKFHGSKAKQTGGQEGLNGHDPMASFRSDMHAPRPVGTLSKQTILEAIHEGAKGMNVGIENDQGIDIGELLRRTTLEDIQLDQDEFLDQKHDGKVHPITEECCNGQFCEVTAIPDGQGGYFLTVLLTTTAEVYMFDGVLVKHPKTDENVMDWASYDVYEMQRLRNNKKNNSRNISKNEIGEDVNAGEPEDVNEEEDEDADEIKKDKDSARAGRKKNRYAMEHVKRLRKPDLSLRHTEGGHHFIDGCGRGGKAYNKTCKDGTYVPCCGGIASGPDNEALALYSDYKGNMNGHKRMLYGMGGSILEGGRIMSLIIVPGVGKHISELVGKRMLIRLTHLPIQKVVWKKRVNVGNSKLLLRAVNEKYGSDDTGRAAVAYCKYICDNYCKFFHFI